MPYVLAPNGAVAQYPYSLGQLRRDHPDTSFSAEPAPESLAAFGVYPVAPAEPPAASAIERLVELEPVLTGDTWAQSWAVEPLPIEDARAVVIEAIRARRWQAEIAGTSVGGVPIRTDEKSQNKIAGAIALFEKNPGLASIDFEAQPNLWVELDGAAVTAIGVAVGMHIQACFSNAKQLQEAALAATDHAGLTEIDIEAGWP